MVNFILIILFTLVGCIESTAYGIYEIKFNDNLECIYFKNTFFNWSCTSYFYVY